MTEKELRKKAMALPLQPGVYIMKNKDKKIIYIGKAKKLKNRVSQYFGSHTNHSLKMLTILIIFFVIANLKHLFWNAR